MYRLMLLLWMLPMIGFGQAIVTSKALEEQSYQAYAMGDWNAVIAKSKQARKEGVDYFYLRLRSGIAYYNLKKYRLAEREFRKALKFDSYETVNREYLYVSYLKNESYELSSKLSRKFDSALEMKTGTSSLPGVGFLYLEGGQKISSNSGYFSNATYYQLGLQHRIGRSLSVGYAFTNYAQGYQYGKIIQKQFYGYALIPVAKTWVVSPSFHYLNVQLESESSYIPQHPPFLPAPPSRTITTTAAQNGYIASLSVEKNTSYFGYRPSVSYSTINSRTQYQGAFQLTYYPLGSNKLSIAGCYYVQKDSALFANGYKITANYKPTQKFKIQASYYAGSMLNYNEENGYLVNNSDYTTKNRMALIPELVLSKKVSVYSILQREEKYLSGTTNSFKYTTILFGLKFKPF